MVAGLAAAGLHRARRRGRALRHREATRAAPPRLVTSLRPRPDGAAGPADRPAQVHVLDLPVDAADDDVALPGAGAGHLRATPTAPTSAGARTAPSWPSCPPATPRAARDLVPTSSRSRRTGRGCAGSPTPAAAAPPGLSPPGGALVVTAVPDLGPDGLDFVARQPVPCRVGRRRGARAAARPGAAPPRRRDARDGRWPTARVLVGVAAAGGGGAAPGAPRRRERRRCSSTARSPCAASRPRAASSSRRGARRLGGGADRHHPGPAAAAHRLRRGAGGDRPGAPDAGADGDRAGRLPGARLGHHAARARPAPGAADDPRRPVRPVRLDAVRRDADLRLGRLRRRPVQPARLLGLRGGARPGDPGAASATSTPPTSSRSSTPSLADPALDGDRVGVMGGSYGGYLTALLIGRTDALRRRHRRAGVHRPGELRRLLRHRLVLPRPVPGHRSRRVAAQSALAHARRSPRRPWSSTPRRTGAARSSRAPASTSSSSAAASRRSCCCSRGRGTSCPVPAGRGTGSPGFEHVLRWWARWLPTRANGPRPRYSSRRTVAGGIRSVDEPPPNRCRSGRPASTDPPRTRSAWQGVRPWWSVGCPAGRSCGTLAAPAAGSPATRPTGGWPAPRPIDDLRDDRPPPGAARGLRLHRRRRRRGDQPAPLAGGVRAGGVPAPACCATCRRSTRRRRCSARRAALPLAFAPTGFTRLMHTEGEPAVARVAERTGIPYALSTMGTTSLEALAAAAPERPAVVPALPVARPRRQRAPSSQRARAAGYEALVLTVDTPVAGPRLRDVRNGFTIPPALTLRTVANAALHPRWWVDLLTTAAAGVRLAALLGRHGRRAGRPRLRAGRHARRRPARCARPGRARWS